VTAHHRQLDESTGQKYLPGLAVEFNFVTIYDLCTSV